MASVQKITRRVEEDRVEMLCPHCEVWQDVLAYKTPDIVVKFKAALNVVVKCGLCRHVFSPRWLSDA